MNYDSHHFLLSSLICGSTFPPMCEWSLLDSNRKRGSRSCLSLILEGTISALFYMIWKSGTVWNTLYAEQTYIDSRAVNVEVKHNTVRRSNLHGVQHGGCSITFSIHYCIRHIYDLLSMTFPDQ